MDDLFNPVLDGNLDELSDARSLAASIKGGIDPLHDIEIDFSGMESLTESCSIAACLKGGGTRTEAEPNEDDGISSGNVFTNVAGMTVPMVDTSQVIQHQLVHQQMIQRAFLASAVQQNLQIQQQLLQQNQALQQLLQTDESSSLPHMPTESSSQNIDDDHNEMTSLKIISPQSLAGNRVGPRSSVPPPPPPPPPSPPNDGSYLDVFGRAKTVRIGKWRWPPPREDSEENGGSSFLEFKMKKHTGKHDAKEDGEMKDKKAPIPPVRTTSVETRDQIIMLQNKSSSVQKSSSKTQPSVVIESKADANVGKLRISSEMKAKLEQLTSDQSVRKGKSTSREKLTQSMEDITEASVKKLSEQRKSLLEQQLMGSMRLPPSTDFKPSIDPSKGLPVQQSTPSTQSDGLVKIEGRFAPHRRSGGREVRERRDELGPNREKENPEVSANSNIAGDFFDDSNYEGSTASAERKVKRMGVPPPPPPNQIRSNGYQISRGPPSITTSSTYYQSSAVMQNSANSLEQSGLMERLTSNGDIRTKLYPMDKSVCLTYSKVNWELRIRKEVRLITLSPSPSFTLYFLHLI